MARFGTAALLSLVLAVAPATAQPVAPTFAVATRQITNGQFVWDDEAPATGDIVVVISLPLQRAFVYRDGLLVAASSVSTGRRGHLTPTGQFPILQKHATHRSNKYSNAPMPFMQRLTWDGVAIHAGHLPGYPASHGCVRVPRPFAQRLFGATRLGALVVINATDDLSYPAGLPVRPYQPARVQVQAVRTPLRPAGAPYQMPAPDLNGHDLRDDIITTSPSNDTPATPTPTGTTTVVFAPPAAVVQQLPGHGDR